MSNKIDLKIQNNGEKYSVSVPDTLDLAERARLSVHGLTGMIDAEHNYEPYHCANMTVKPAYMNHTTGGCCTPKVMEALLLTRIMSGSEEGISEEAGMWEWMLGGIEDDGLWWLRTEGRPWYDYGFDKSDCLWITMNARFVIVLLEKYKLSGGDNLLDTAKSMADGLINIALPKKDGGYYYPDDIYYRGGWKLDENGSGLSPFAGQRVMASGNAIRACSLLYEECGEERFIKFAADILGNVVSPEIWQSPPALRPTMIAGFEHGHWTGHYHTNTHIMLGIAEYARITNNAYLKRFTREFYEYARCYGIAKIGFFPAIADSVGTIVVTDTNDNGELWKLCESCCTADMICLARILSDAGVGDYWDDIDQMTVNHLAEEQMLDKDLLYAISDAGPDYKIDKTCMTDEKVIEKLIGTFAVGSDPDVIYPVWTICCVGNCNTALYRAWEGITRFDGKNKTATVNLLLNRASPWVDIDSCLPYEGKVIIKNKTAEKICVRIPNWVNKKDIRCSIENFTWLNNYMILDNIKPGENIIIEFPVITAVESYTVPAYKTKYNITFKGNTAVDISPRSEKASVTDFHQDDGLMTRFDKFYPIYMRDNYKNQNSAPIVERIRFVSDKQI